MRRRQFNTLVSASMAGALLSGITDAWSQARDDESPIILAPKIIDALSSKAVVLDDNGPSGRPLRSRRRGPSINLQVQFTFDSADLLPLGKRQLDELAMALSDISLQTSAFRLAGHTDRVGDADYNIKLSLARAEAVKAYLAEAHRVSPDRLQTIGYGFGRLLDTAHPKAAINRRVEVQRLTAVAPQVLRESPAAGRLVLTPK